MSNSNYGFEITPNGIIIKSTSEIYDDVMNDWQEAFKLKNQKLNSSPYTPQGQIVTSLADAIANKNADLLSVINNFDLDKAEGIWLDFWGSIWGLTRKKAIPTTVMCRLTGIGGTVIYGKENPIPSKAMDVNGNVYVPSTQGTIGPEGVLDLQFEAQIPGALECAADTLTIILTTTPGWDTINNPAAGIVGADLESDNAFRARIRQLTNQNATGTIGSIQTAILNLSGVLDAVGRENPLTVQQVIDGYTFPANTYTVSVLGGEDAAIGQVILDKRSPANMVGNATVTAVDETTGQSYTFNIIRPTRLDYKIKVVLSTIASYPTDIESIVKNAVFENFYADRVHIASTIFASRFYKPITDAYPQANVINILIATQPEGGAESDYSSSATCPLDEYPALSLNDIEVTYE